MSDRKRPVRFRKRLSLLVAVVLSLAITVILVKKSSVLPNQLNRYVNDHYLKGTDFVFSCRSVGGDLVNVVTLSDVRLRYQGADTAFDLFRARHITLDYSIYQVLKLDLVINQLEIESARVSVVRDEGGELLVPPIGPGGEDTAPGPAPQIVVKKYEIRDLDLSYRDSTHTVEVTDIDLGGELQIAGNEGHIEIGQGSAFLPGTRTHLQSLEFEASYVDDLLSLDNLLIRLDRSYIMASGKYQDGALRHLQFVFNPLDLQEISSLGLIPENDGEVGGNLTMSGTLDTLNIRGSITGKASGLVLSGFSFSGAKTGSLIDFSQVEGTVFGSYIKGAFRYRTGDNGGYSFDGKCRGLDITEGFISSDGIPETDLYGHVTMDFNRRLDRYRFNAALDTSSVGGFKSRRLGFDGMWTGVGGLNIDLVSFENPGFTLTGTGTISPTGDADLILNLNGDDISYVWDYLGLPRIDTRIAVSGKAAGPMDNLQINLNGTIENASYLFASVDSGTVTADIRSVPTDSVAAKVAVRGRNITLPAGRFSDPHIAVEAGNGPVRVTDFSFADGDTLVTTDFEVVPAGENQDILFKHFAIKMPSETWAAESPTLLHLDGNTARLDTITISSRGGSVRFAGTYAADDGRFDLYAEGREVDASIVRQSFGIPWQLEGKSRFTADFSGTVERTAMRVEFDLGSGSVRGVPLDRLFFICRYDPSGYSLDDLLVVSGDDSLSGSGTWRLPLSPVQLARSDDREERMLEAPWSFDLAGSHFPLHAVFNLLKKTPPIDGRYTGSFTVAGSPAETRFGARGTLGAITESSIRFPDMNLILAYEDNLVDITSIAFDDGKMNGTIEGRLPVSFTLSEGFRVRSAAPFSLRASIASNDLSVLAEYFDRIDLARGELTSSIRAYGTLDDPRLSGNLSFEKGAARLRGMEELYRDVNGRITFLDDMVQLSALSGRVGEKGSFHASGSARLKAFKPIRYQVDCTVEDFLLSSIHDFLSLQDGTVSLSSLGTGERPLTPTLSGHLYVKQATITRSLSSETGGTPSPLMMPTEQPSWYCDLEIEAPKKIFIKNPGLNMELGGDVILKRDKSGLYLRGELAVLRGSYTIYNNKFTITDGLFNFSAATTMRPEIDLNAYNVYRMGDEEHRIFLNLSWPQDKKEPQVTLSSDTPGYSETDIWKMLGGTYVATGSSDTGWDAAGTAQNIAGNYLENVLNTQMHDLTIDVESRTLEGTSGSRRPEREMTIAIGKYLSEDLYLKYRQGLSISSEREVDIEYRIGTIVVLRSEIIRHSGRQLLGKSSQATDEINFDIKLRFEY